MFERRYIFQTTLTIMFLVYYLKFGEVYFSWNVVDAVVGYVEDAGHCYIGMWTKPQMEYKKLLKNETELHLADFSW